MFQVQTEQLSPRRLSVDIPSWQDFAEYSSYLSKLGNYVWRGQQDARWMLQSSFDRMFDETFPSPSRDVLASRHLENFKMATRGRRDSGLLPSLQDEEWWALAQHNAMKTPLLDWTQIPKIALYFAFEKLTKQTGIRRAVWALDRDFSDASAIDGRSEGSLQKGKTKDKEMTFINPIHDGNARLLSQRGLFTRVPFGTTIEKWIDAQGPSTAGRPSLVKISIPEGPSDRSECLKDLELGNISHLTLFPDLYGAGVWCNTQLSFTLGEPK